MDKMESNVEVSETTHPEQETARRKFFKAAAVTAAGLAIGTALAEKAEAQGRNPSGHLQIVFDEGRITREDLHAALDLVLASVVPPGGCNCGLTGFDLTFLRGDPALYQFTQVPNVQMGVLTRI